MRELVDKIRERYPTSGRRACRLIRFSRSSHQYQGVRPNPLAQRHRLRDRALSRPRWSYRRLHTLLCRGMPKRIFVDNGSEFSGRLMDLWAYHHGVGGLLDLTTG